MRKLTAVIIKEFLVLIRDIPGLSILFIMPVFLILAVTLTQEQSKQNIDNPRFGMLIIDEDTGSLGSRIEEEISTAGIYNIVSNDDKNNLNLPEAERLISEGKYQVGIYIPPGFISELESKIDKLFLKEMPASDDTLQESEDTFSVVLTVLLDPAVNELFTRTVVGTVNTAVRSVEIEIINEINRFILLRTFEQISVTGITETFQRLIPEKKSFINTVTGYAQIPSSRITPSFIQNNVPAFALFAMFFIVVPLAGGMITEKNDGTYNRLRILQVSYLTILAGKVVVFSIVCALQFIVMILCGMYLFPEIIGIEALEIGSNIPALIIAIFSSALAAIGFGLFTGTVFNTHGQAAMFGALMNVILCILGGVFIPVFMMPDLLNSISIFTPLRWAMDSFMAVFVRDGGIQIIFPDIFRLLIFFIISVFISVLSYIRRD